MLMTLSITATSILESPMKIPLLGGDSMRLLRYAFPYRIAPVTVKSILYTEDSAN